MDKSSREGTLAGDLPLTVVGIDEVGRGCWAGPLVAGAVILPSKPLWEDSPPKGNLVLRDSKKMSKRRREIATEWLHEQAVATGLGWVWPAELDDWGISTAVKVAMERALAEVEMALAETGVVYDRIIVDGNINYLAANPKATALIKADDSVPGVSAASILAKVARDNYMTELARTDARYAGYGFDKHVGYGTAAHITALKTLGVSDIHRRSYKPVQALLA